MNNALPEEDVSVLKAVIAKKKAAFAKLGQRPSEEALARLCPNCKAAQPRDEPPTCAACEAKSKEKHKPRTSSAVYPKKNHTEVNLHKTYSRPERGIEVDKA